MHKNNILIYILLVLMGLSAPVQAAVNPDELLMPDQAFQIKGRADGPDHLLVEWRIADGYYMYLSLIHISEPTRPPSTSRMPSSA